MKTFEQCYCEKYSCDPSRFLPRVFYAALPWYIRPTALLFGGVRGKYFLPDRNLLLAVAEAQTIQQITDEVHDHFMNPANQTWLKQRLHVRISTKSLKAIAVTCGLADKDTGRGLYR